MRHDPRRAPRCRGAFRRPRGVRRAATRPSPTPSCSSGSEATRCRYLEHRLEPGDRVVVWGPNSIDWAVAALAVSYAGGVLVPVNSRYTGARGRRHRRAHPAPRSSWSPTASSAATSSPSCARPATCRRGTGQPSTAHDRPSRRGAALAPTSRPRRSRRGPTRSRPTTSPTSSSPPAPPAAPKGAMTAHRQTIGVARAWAELGGVRAGRPLPRGQPVLPLLRLQDRHRGRPAHRRHALPGRDLRPRRDDGADRVRADHRAARRADDLPVAAQRPGPRPTSTSRRCGSRSPAPPSYPWC